METNKKKPNVLKYLLVLLLVVLLGVSGFFGYKKYQVHLAEKQVENINKILTENKTSIYSCKIILEFDKSLISDDNEFFREKPYDDFREKCDVKYNIARINIEEEICESIIIGNKSDFEDKFVLLDDFEDVRSKCTRKFLSIKFHTGSFFDVENDFKTSINLEFSLAFYEDSGELNSDEFLENRIEAKKRLVELLDVTGGIKLDYQDIILYPKKAIINLPLQPLTDYSISLKSFESKIEGENIKPETFSFKTPENKYFGFKILDKKSLYRDTDAPKFQLLDYNSPKTKTKLKICRIDNEVYAKIEVFRKSKALLKEKNDFFINGIDKLKTYECKERELSIKETASSTGSGVQLIKKDFSFNSLIGNPARSGLYYVTFSDPEDREYNSIIQKPVFFGIIDSHIVMKTSRNGEAFFFVNDFDGKPLAGQKIRAYVNEFIGKKATWNRQTRKNDEQYFSPLDTNVFAKPVLLGETGKDGILKVDLKGKIDGAFSKTFESWGFDWNEKYDSFFITSASESNLTYVSSTWNGGIAPWNFGYTVGSSWWYGARSQNADEITLDGWGRIEPELYTHIFTDRKLYLPGEEVNLKAIIRKSSDLSIPYGKEIKLQVKDSKGKEVLGKNYKINNYGSISETIELEETYPLGNYIINLIYGDKTVGYGGFSVEIFKNPKFKNEIVLKTEGLNGGSVKIEKEEKDKEYSWRNKYSGDFKLRAYVNSKYYSGSPVGVAEYKYKVYKQAYYDNSYWDNCYYGCYWEPTKELYTEGKGNLDVDGKANFEIPVAFESNYNDFKYIVEVQVKDNAGDSISGANSIIAKLPNEYKKWDPNSGIYFKSEKRFYKAGETAIIEGGLDNGEWGEHYEDKFMLIIKKKEYETKIVDDVRGYKRPITRSTQKLEKILKVNSKNFEVTKDKKLKLKYKLLETGEYVFEFGKINSDKLKFKSFDINDLIKEFSESKKLELIKESEKEITINYDEVNYLIENCVGDKKECDRTTIYKNLGCLKGYIGEDCRNKEQTVKLKQKIKLDDLISKNSRKFYTLLTYSDREGSNPVLSDNKITVLSEKVSYKLGEKARVLVRLPYIGAKILLTKEKQGVLESKYFDVKGNTFFTEVVVDDTFVPNAYIGVMVVDTRKEVIPEYKVGYTEIVVDKTEKKAFVDIKSNKKKYEPREEVILDLKVTDKKGNGKQAELTVMVVDDSLISLMGNVDLNTLEKFYKKLPFQIQTSITNIAMLKNYYFSRPGIVGGGGFGNFKGGDSAVSTRNIFKNTAYYNPSVITSKWGNAQVKFTLPDNLTNFRVLVLSNSKDNLFGHNEHFIEVRKDVVIEDKTPIIIRNGDELELGANIFNNTDKKIGFSVKFESDLLGVQNNEKGITIGANKKEFISWTTKIAGDINTDTINYKITLLGDSKEHSDKLEGTIKIKESPIVLSSIIRTGFVAKGEVYDTTIEIPKNTDLNKTKVELVFSNYKLKGIEKIVNSLARYPYGCIEQTMSSTYPNAVLLKFNELFKGIIVDEEEIEKNLKAGIARVKSMQTKDGGFAYWPGDINSDLHITPFVLRRLVDMKEFGVIIPTDMIEKATKYLENNLSNISIDVDKAETFLSFVKVGKGQLAYDKLIKTMNKSKISRHALITYTYGLVLLDKKKFEKEILKNIELIKGKLTTEEHDYRYWNSTSDKAIFTSMLIDYGYNKAYTTELIDGLYILDWESYYYSTQSKNNAFVAFSKYIENSNLNSSTRFGFSLGTDFNRGEIESIKKGDIFKKEYLLKDIVYEGRIDLKAANVSGSDLYIDLVLKKYPKNITKVEASATQMHVERNIYEIVDEYKFNKCSEELKRYNNRNHEDVTQVAGCEGVLKKHEGDIFEKGKLYKVKVSSIFPDNRLRRNLVIEDYLPASFRVINSKFKTESISLAQTSTKGNYRDHLENRPDVVFFTRDRVWSKETNLTYFFRPEFKGKFTYPPVSSYMMYNPRIMAHGKYRKIEVK